MQAQQAVQAFNERVQQKVASGQTRRRAIRSVVKQDPGLHEAYLRATNSPRQSVQDAIGGMFSPESGRPQGR